MIPRVFATQVRHLLRKFPAVAILGPRQCGKTTLARQIGGVYFDLEEDGSATRLDAEWNELSVARGLVILDEAQHAPWVFSRLRGTIDADRKRNGRFLVLGSVSPALMHGVSESLAGRLGIVRMSPFLLPEVGARRLDDIWLYGGYPDGGICDDRMFPDWQMAYVETLVSRDLPNWGMPARPLQTRRLLHMLASLHGQQLNASQIAASMALDHKTVLRHCEFLEGAFLIRRLQPYFTNTRKRLVKSPRVYWRDSGLLHALMGVGNLDQLYRQPWVGASWEGFVVEQTLSAIDAGVESPQCYFFRAADGHELDLVIDWGVSRWAVEIKLTSNPSTETIARLNKAADLIDADQRVLVCRIGRKIESERLLVIRPAGWLRRLRSGHG